MKRLFKYIRDHTGGSSIGRCGACMDISYCCSHSIDTQDG